MFTFVQNRKWYFLLSGILIAISLAAMGISTATYPEHSPVRLSIDFLGGSLFEVQFKPETGIPSVGTITESHLRAIFSQFTNSDIRVQRLGEVASNKWQIRTSFFDNDKSESLQASLNEIAKPFGLQLDPTSFHMNQVSPTVGAEAGRAAAVAVIVASFIVIGFIIIAFRKVPNAVRYGVCAIIAMIHDILILVGAMSVLGLVLGWEADSLFLTAMLTVVAYSVQDSIVVFDRIRENIVRRRGEPYEIIVNRSVIETIQRSVTTQILIALVLISLILIGGATIRPFVTVLLVGLISGTYSSLCIGIPFLVSWEEGELSLIKRGTLAKAA